MYEMHEKIDGLKMAVAACVGLLTGLWGWLGWLVLGWILCMALDWVTGYLAAMHNGGGLGVFDGSGLPHRHCCCL